MTEPAELADLTPLPTRRAGWAVVVSYAGVAGSTQLLWLTYAPITTGTAQQYGVSETAVGWLANAFPLLYVVLALPAGLLLDARLRPALTAGALLTGAGGLLRLGGDSFGWALAGQTLVAVAQPLVLGAITRTIHRCLHPSARTAGIALASAGIFLGMVAALALGAVFGGDHLHALLVVQGLIGAVSAGALVVAMRAWPAERSAEPGAAAAGRAVTRGTAEQGTAEQGAAVHGTAEQGTAVHGTAEQGTAVHGTAEQGTAELGPAAGILAAWGDPVIRRLAALSLAGFGVFVALTTWLQALVEPDGISQSSAGVVLAAAVSAGVVLSAVVPELVAHRAAEPNALRVALVLAATGCAVLAVWRTTAIVAGATIVVVAGMLVALPILLDLCERRPGHNPATSANLIWLAGNLGGLVVALVVGALVDHPAPAFALMALAALAGLPLLPRNVFLGRPREPEAP